MVKHEHDGDTPNEIKPAPKASSAFVNFVCAIAAYCRTKAEQPYDLYSRQIARWTIASSIATWLTAIGAIFAACFSFSQLGEMQKTYKQAELTHQRSIRPYVFFEAGGRILLENGRYKAELKIKNSGQTPAYSLTTSLSGSVANSQVKYDISGRPTDIPPRTNLDFKQDLGPQTVIPFPDWPPTHTFEIGQNEISEIKSGRKSILLMGRIEYRYVWTDGLNSYDSPDNLDGCNVLVFWLRNGAEIHDNSGRLIGWDIATISHDSFINRACNPTDGHRAIMPEKW